MCVRCISLYHTLMTELFFLHLPHSSSSSSGHPTRAWTESQQLPPSSSSYSATTPPLFPSPLFLSAHQSHHGYPPGYQPTTSLWPVPSPQGAPIPSLCSSTSTSSIPSLIPDEWYRHQRKKKERYMEESVALHFPMKGNLQVSKMRM